jgi:hypothetical protein
MPEWSQFVVVSVNDLSFRLGFRRRELERIAAIAGRFYRPFDRKRSSDDTKWRHIDNPVDELKVVQGRLLRRLWAELPFPETVVGGRKGGSIKTNAGFHLEQEALATIDIRNCFPSTNEHRVFDALRSILGCSTDVASLLTRLTTFQARLPQGAPTSGTLMNLVLLPLHLRLLELAKSRGLRFSAYVDDLAFSGPRDQAEAIIPLAIQAVNQFGFCIGSEKVALMPQHVKQKLTGTVTNSRLSVGRERVAGVRRRIHELADGPFLDGRALASVWGSIRQISSVNQVQGAYLERFAQSLLPRTVEGRSSKPEGLIRPCRSFNREHKETKTRPAQ